MWLKMTEPVISLPMKRVEDWKSRLIDLSRKNNLLYFRKGKRGNLPITQPDAQKIFDVLVLKKKRLEFFVPQEEVQKPEISENPKAKGEAKSGKANVKTVKAPSKTATPPE